MDIVSVLIRQNVLMMVYLVIGYLLYKKKIVTQQGCAEVGKVLLYIVIPAAILKSYAVEYSTERLTELGISFVTALAALLLSILITRVFFKKSEGIELFGVAFSNAGFIGIPLVQSVIGEHAAFYVASFVALLNILQWTYGVFVMTRDASVISRKSICTNPIVISFLIGLVLFFCPITIPAIMLDAMGALAGMNGPLAMLVLGIYLAQISMKSMFVDKHVYKSTIVRLVIIPIATIVLLAAVPKSYYEIKLALLIVAAAPIGSNVAIFAHLYHKDYQQAVKEICMSTLFCVLTMPFVVYLGNHILGGN